MLNPQFVGYYKIPSEKELIDRTERVVEITGISRSSIKRMYYERERKVHNVSYNKHKFLQGLGPKEDVVGKTYYELGFVFYPNRSTNII